APSPAPFCGSSRIDLGLQFAILCALLLRHDLRDFVSINAKDWKIIIGDFLLGDGSLLFGFANDSLDIGWKHQHALLVKFRFEGSDKFIQRALSRAALFFDLCR